MTDIGTSEATAQVDGVTSLWVIVRSNKNLFGFDANLVGKMIALSKVTHGPAIINYMAGTITVRGAVIPLIDLRVYSGEPSADQEVADFCALMDQRTAAVELEEMVGLFEDIKKASREASRRRITLVLELEDRALALDIDEVVAVGNITKIDVSPQRQTRNIGVSRIERRDKDDALVLLMGELAF